MGMEGAKDELDGSGSHDEHKVPIYKLSCDHCRQRKVRCDRTHPCGPCSRKQLSCTYPAGYKPRTKRKQLRVSQGYEQKLDDISRKIDHICLSLDKLGSSSSKPDKPTSTNTAAFSYTTPQLPENNESDDDSGPGIGGDVALESQAAFATHLAERLVDSAHPMEHMPEVKSSLRALKQSLAATQDKRKRGPPTVAKLISHPSSVGGLSLPPMQIAMLALQRLRESMWLKLLWSMEFESVSQFVEYFMTVYSGKPSLADTLIVHCGLHRLFVQCGNAESDDSLKKEFYAQGALCGDNLTVILSSMPFNIPSSFDFALALYMTSAYYLQSFKLSMTWNSLVVACQICQTLGYNREALATPETSYSKQRRTKLFWSIYMLDKMVALRLNRPSSLRDGDITLRVQTLDIYSTDQTMTVFPGWIETATLHGKIYDDIYSLSALAESTDVRDGRAREIAGELERVFTTTGAMEAYFAHHNVEDIGGQVIDIMMRAERISQLATLTLVYRGIRPATDAGSAFCPECLHTANQCLEEHRACLDILKDVELSIVELYVQWALLSAPFIPFIVIFCHVIETRDEAHLGKLSAVVETLQLLPATLPDIYRKQLRLFKLMYDVACKYINSPTSTPSVPTIQRATDMPFEMFYSEAGLPLPSRLYDQSSSATREHGQQNATFNSYGTELGHWFDQNQHIFTMLEDTF